jgi:adenine C2-methylase RlmN of 23S rRNA A2503 and tRNA A37
MSNPSGLSIGQPKITLSTSGVVPNIYRLAEDTKVNLGTRDPSRPTPKLCCCCCCC